MSFKIEDSNGIKIGGVLNPSITVVYVRTLPNMKQQTLIWEKEEIGEGVFQDKLVAVEISTELRPSENGALDPDLVLKIDGITPEYQGKYSATTIDIPGQYLEVQQDIKAQLEEQNPDLAGKITIVDLPILGV